MKTSIDIIKEGDNYYNVNTFYPFRIVKFLFITIMALSVLIGCKKDSENPTPDPGGTKKVYIAGNRIKEGAKFSTYWINDSVVPFGLANTEATGIFVSGNDIYVSGYSNSSNNGQTRAVLWKNDPLNTLFDFPTEYSLAYSVAVSGTDIYVAGLSLSVAKDKDVATIWKNGVLSRLSNDYSYAYKVKVQGSDVYVGGSDFISGSGYNAAIWKNGVRTFLNTTSSEVKDLVIDGNVVIASGNTFQSVPGESIRVPFATYWNNGIEKIISNVPNSTANSIALVGKDIYISVNESEVSNLSVRNDKLWKNGKTFSLKTNEKSFVISSLASAGGELYIAGYSNDDGSPKIWKWVNDRLELIYTLKEGNSQIKDIFVK